MAIDRKYISIAADIVRSGLSLSIPITLDSLCESINNHLPGHCIKVSPVNLKIDAEIFTTKDNNFEIKYLKDRPEKRILFSISHELGHLFLHLLKKDGTLESGISYERNSDKSLSETELEANEFAAAFLMPEEDFLLVCRNNIESNKINIKKVAEYFNVSIQAATVRGSVLGLW